ncbi:pyruvate formate lyase-activating protein [Halosquirtibacter xylanolyticus]|uniref:pyruvate formate-lyase-activating protein n=1 Tax=Halosquirtibacter xylanolyticus TaxID=3374599 RepID=UPI003748CA0D|nr:pyruvate formate lyase-activating protein [Prolixibacteraceae bacterium]
MESLSVHSIESFGTHDGPGVRMIIFTQGCKFKCLYCHNPDTIPMDKGTKYDLEDLVRRAVNMKGYFGKLGGVTISGGEPLIHSKDLIPLFKRFKEEGINTNIDTNGRVLNAHTKELIDKYADLVMLDIKHINNEWHKKITGGHEVTYPLRFAAHRESSGKPMWIRYVLVPGWTDQPEYLHQLGEHFKDYKTIEKIEIQPYHQLGVHKWESLGWEYELKDVQENSDEQLQKAKEILSQYFKEVKVN